MSRRNPFLLGLAIITLAFVAAPAQAVLITVNFSVTGDNSLDPANFGVTSSGNFTFDSSLIPAGGGSAIGSFPYETSINFSWDGTTYTAANADVTSLVFDASGNLTAWGWGGTPTGATNINAFTNADDVLFDSTQFAPFRYARQGNTTFVFGVTNTTWTVDYGQSGGSGDTGGSGSAPEPTSWMLLAGCLVGVGAIRRRSNGQ